MQKHGRKNPSLPSGSYFARGFRRWIRPRQK